MEIKLERDEQGKEKEVPWGSRTRRSDDLENYPYYVPLGRLRNPLQKDPSNPYIGLGNKAFPIEL